MNLTSLIIPPWLKIVAPIAAIALAIIVFRFIWLPAHDLAVRAEYLVELKEQARKDSEKASNKAGAKQELRNDAFEKSQAGLANATDADDWAKRLRAEQCRAGKIAPPC